MGIPESRIESGNPMNGIPDSGIGNPPEIRKSEIRKSGNPKSEIRNPGIHQQQQAGQHIME